MPIKVFVTVTEGPNEGQSFDFSSGEKIIGRGKADLTLNDKKVSNQHCRFWIEGNQLFVEDLQSTNGTYMAGRRLTEKKTLQNLDTLTMGLTKLSIAIVDQISEFQSNRVSTPPQEVFPDSSPEEEAEPVADVEEPFDEDSEPATRRASPDDFLPPPDAAYRETGVRRIEDLIEKEIQTVSKWDHPEAPEEKTGQAVGIIPRIEVRLTKRSGPEGISHFVCSKPVTTMGRKGVDVKLNDLDCSRSHAQIEIVGGVRAFVKDLASTNGTFVNGKKITMHELQPGDLIQIGQTVLAVEILQE